MLRKYNNRTFEENIKLGIMTAFCAGMVNIASLLIFFSFASNITGHYAILAAEVVKGNYYQVAVVFAWISLFFTGSFISGLSVTHLNQKNTYIAHSLPIVMEIICLLCVGIYGQFFYMETLKETEILLALMLFAMGLQNGLTASISKFTIKTTHLTGTTTDLGILFAMFTKKEYRENRELKAKAKLLLAITIGYFVGSMTAGLTYLYMEFQLFYVVCLFLVIVILHDFYNFKLIRYIKIKQIKAQRIYLRNKASRRSGGRRPEPKMPTYKPKELTRM